MSVTLVPVERMYRNKNRSETYVEVRFKTLILESREYHPQGNYRFITVLHLINHFSQTIVVPVDRKVTGSLANERLSAALTSNYIKK